MSDGRPNILFVFPDEYRQQAVGCMHADPVTTPNLDRLGAEGVVFTHAVSNRPVCSPYRAMLFSGRYPHANGVLTNCNSETVRYANYLRAEQRCLSDVLHEAGYACGYIGKWHLDPPDEAHCAYTEGRRGDGKIWDSFTPPERRHGFTFWHAYGCCDRHLNPHYWHTDTPLEEPIEPHEWSVKHETDVAVEFLENADGAQRDPDAPFALFVAFNPPHMPFQQVPQTYAEMYADKTAEDLLHRPNLGDGPGGRAGREHVKNYFAAVTGIDVQVGRILDALRRIGEEENTIVIFTADHGEMMGSHDLMHKVVWYDESLLVPFLLRWPRAIAPRRDDLLLSVPDLFPTLLGLCGLGDRIPDGVQGRDWSEAVRTGKGERPDSALYLDVRPESPAGGRRGLRTHRHTFVVERTEAGERVRLYDNETDPFQQEEVAAEHPEAVRWLTERLDAWLAYTGDPWLEAGNTEA